MTLNTVPPTAHDAVFDPLHEARGPSPHETSGPEVLGDTGSFPSHAELARTLTDAQALATLATLTASGHPYSSIAPYSTLVAGAPLVCVSDLAEHTQNLRRDPRSSLLVQREPVSGVDPLALPRVTLVGSFVPYDPSDAEVEAHLAVHPHARHYVEFEDFTWWRFETSNVRYVGGFGVMGWCNGAEFATALADPVIANADPIIEHLNVDHADACRDIAEVLGGCDATNVRAASIDLVRRARAGASPRTRNHTDHIDRTTDHSTDHSTDPNPRPGDTHEQR